MKQEPMPLELVREYLRERHIEVGRISTNRYHNFETKYAFFVAERSHRYPSTRYKVSGVGLDIAVRWVAHKEEEEIGLEIYRKFDLHDPESMPNIYDIIGGKYDGKRVKDLPGKHWHRGFPL